MNLAWPVSDEEWAAVSPEFIFDFVHHEGMAFDIDWLGSMDEECLCPDGKMRRYFDQFDWRFDPVFPVSCLVPIMRDGRAGWERWYQAEKDQDPDYTKGGTGDYYPELEKAVVENPRVLDPIICLQFTTEQPTFCGPRAKINIGDGWHRSAISILKNLPTIRAMVGKHKWL